MVVSKLVFTVEPRQAPTARNAVRQSERILAADGRCRRWCIVQSGPNEFTSYAFYDDAAQAEATLPQIYKCLRDATGAFATVSRREVREVVLDRIFDA